MTRRALVSGAGIAGPAVAHWLHRYGWHVTVVERADGVRIGGQNIDVHGVGRDVAERMGVLDRIRDANTGELGTEFVRSDGSVIARFPQRGDGEAQLTRELEILRGDLARILVDAAPEAEYRWNDQIVAVREVESGVEVDFKSGRSDSFDVLIAADGVSSSTRGLVFGDEVELRTIGLETAWATIPRESDDTDWWRWYIAPGCSLSLRPDPYGTIRATVSRTIRPRDTPVRDLPRDEQMPVLREIAAGAGWQDERILAGVENAGDLYVENLTQVKAPSWSRGNVVLLGDAAHCATPVTGMGTSLALVGAYVLAGELASRASVSEALSAYEERLRPFVERAQKLPPGVPRVANPTSRLGVRAVHTALRLAGSAPIRFITGRLGGGPAKDEFDLPDYRGHETA